MQRFMVVALICLGACASTASASNEIQQQLSGALTCDGSPLETVNALAEQGSGGFAQGYAGYQFGEEMDLVSGVVLREPLMIGAASTSHVVASLGSFHFGFTGYVFARFAGDPVAVVTLLNLSKSDKPEGETFVRAMPAVDDNDVCPPTIELKALDDGSFLLGCGWCNG